MQNSCNKSAVKKYTATTLNFVFLFTIALPANSRADDQHGSSETMLGDHQHDDFYADLPPLGFSLTEGWLDPWPHTHFSRSGTPFVHGFGLEPAYLDRDLFFDFAFVRGGDENEFETEIELEWAFTRRLGFVLEVPYIQRNPDFGSTETGFGDMAIAPRALLYESDRFLLSANLEIGFPTGDETKGFGGEEVGLAPSISTWLALGRRTTLQIQFGYETGVESGDSEIFYSAAITHAIYTRANAPHHDPIHFPPGMVNLISEFTGRTGVDGEEEGETSAELLLGLSYLLTPHWEIRGAYQFPIIGDTELEGTSIFGVIYHF